MPNRDKTGPAGVGPLTGRGLGPCNQDNRQGFGCGRGLGRYFAWNQPQTEAEQKQSLVDYRKALEEELEDVKKQESNLK